MGMQVDLESLEARRNPYPAYRQLQEGEPLHWSPAWNAWLITRHADAETAFKDRRLSANRSAGYAATLPEPVKQQLRPLIENLSHWTLLLDPPDHTRLRGLIMKAFTPRSVEAMRPRIKTLVNELLDGFAGKAEIDLIKDFANPLPTIVIGDMLGIPASECHRLKQWSDGIAAFMGAAKLTPDVVGGGLKAVVEMEAYLKGVMEEHRKAPRENLMSQLLAAEEAGEKLTVPELFATCTSLLFGGHETTTNLIGNAILTLARHPEQYQQLRKNPSLIDTAVEEVLRYEAPVQRMGRVALEDVAVGGGVIPKGQRVFMVMGATNRDPRQFPEADRFDISRKENRHLTLGYGIHFCLGAALGRMEGQLAISAIAERLTELRVDFDRAPWIDNLTIRGVKALPLAWAAGDAGELKRPA